MLIYMVHTYTKARIAHERNKYRNKIVYILYLDFVLLYSSNIQSLIISS